MRMSALRLLRWPRWLYATRMGTPLCWGLPALLDRCHRSRPVLVLAQATISHDTCVELCALNCKYVTSFAVYLLLLLPRLSAMSDPVKETLGMSELMITKLPRDCV
jgi:hypothetical protein